MELKPAAIDKLSGDDDREGLLFAHGFLLGLATRIGTRTGWPRGQREEPAATRTT
jgi:hypothetical protein